MKSKIEKRLDNEIKWFKTYHNVDADWTSTSVLRLLQRIKENQDE